MPSQVFIEIQGSKQLRDRLGRFSTAIDGEAQSVLIDIAKKAQETARSYAPKDLGALRRDISVEPRGLTVEVTSSMDYSATQEYGRKAGATPPPWRALLGWVRRHIPNTNDERTARVVAQSIGRKGFRGKYFMTLAGYAAEREVKRRLVIATAKVSKWWAKP